MKLKYSLYEYKEAKEFLKDATVVKEFKNSNIYSSITYRKPDGSFWHETENHLEFPIGTYSLVLIN